MDDEPQFQLDFKEADSKYLGYLQSSKDYAHLHKYTQFTELVDKS